MKWRGTTNGIVVSLLQLDTRFERGHDIFDATTEALMHFVIAYAISEECHCRSGTIGMKRRIHSRFRASCFVHLWIGLLFCSFQHSNNGLICNKNWVMQIWCDLRNDRSILIGQPSCFLSLQIRLLSCGLQHSNNGQICKEKQGLMLHCMFLFKDGFHIEGIFSQMVDGLTRFKESEHPSLLLATSLSLCRHVLLLLLQRRARVNGSTLS